MSSAIFIIVMVHLLVGFGWALYKISGKNDKPKD